MIRVVFSHKNEKKLKTLNDKMTTFTALVISLIDSFHLYYKKKFKLKILKYDAEIDDIGSIREGDEIEIVESPLCSQESKQQSEIPIVIEPQVPDSENIILREVIGKEFEERTDLKKQVSDIANSLSFSICAKEGEKISVNGTKRTLLNCNSKNCPFYLLFKTNERHKYTWVDSNIDHNYLLENEKNHRNWK